MTEENLTIQERSKIYFFYLIFIIIIIAIVDSYTTSIILIIPSQVIEEFLSDIETNAAQSVFALCSGLASIGMYFVFINQYSADRFGRKKLLAFTVLGMGFASLMLILSTNIIEYTIFLFLLYIFFNSDIWTIYINEECPDDKRALTINIILMTSLIGVFLASIFRGIFITERSPLGSWRALPIFTALLGIPLAIIIILTFKETSVFEKRKINKHIERNNSISFKEKVQFLFKYPHRNEFIVILILSLINGLNYIFLALGEVFLSHSSNLNESQINLGILITAFCLIITYLFSGVVGDKIGRKILLYLWSIINPICTIILVYTVYSGQTSLIIIYLTFGVAFSSWWGLMGSIRLVTIEIIPTEQRGTGNGLKSLISSFGITGGLFLSSIFIIFFGLGFTLIIFSLPLLLNVILIAKYIRETKGTDLTNIV